LVVKLAIEQVFELVPELEQELQLVFTRVLALVLAQASSRQVEELKSVQLVLPL